jgi:hypothetical protein
MSSITDAVHDSFDTEDYFNEESSSTLLPPSLPPLPQDVIQVGRCICPNETNTNTSKKCGRSTVGKYFQVYKAAKFKAWTFCTLCLKQVNYTDTMSTGMLLRHLQRRRRRFRRHQNLRENFWFCCLPPKFWKSVHTLGHPNLSSSLFLQEPTIKTPFIGRERLQILPAKEATEIRVELKKAFQGVYFKRTWILHRFALDILKNRSFKGSRCGLLL